MVICLKTKKFFTLRPCEPKHFHGAKSRICLATSLFVFDELYSQRESLFLYDIVD